MIQATKNFFNILPEIDVLLDFGRYSNSFKYLDGKNLGVDKGDIVSVKLKGRLVNGLVVKKGCLTELGVEKKTLNIKYSFIEKIVEKKVVQDWWGDWLASQAEFYKVSDLKMLKTAFPPGWIGKYQKQSETFRNYFWISINPKVGIVENTLKQNQFSLLNKIKSSNGIWQSELINDGFSASTINTLIKKNLLLKTKRQRKNILDKSVGLEKDNIIFPDLTAAQHNAVNEIKQLRPGETLLLWGETGSGKTEVYMRVFEEELLNKKSCLILAPEIGLIPQLLDRFRNRFNYSVIEYHSNCSSKHRALVWRRLLDSSEPLIIIGTRSAIFLPINNLGIIILDEEHDNSYKQDSPMPCYDARKVAIDRVKRTKIKLVLGSATPSISTWKEYFFEKKFKMARMVDRISNTKIPEIKIVDMREEFKKGNKKILSQELLDSLSELREKREQAIILIPRRGYGGFLSCRKCGYVVNCPNCDVALSVHIGSKGTKWLFCHWCNHKTRFLTECPDCRSYAFKPFGIGTQKVVEFLNMELPQLRLLRFDRDTTSGRDGHREILSKFASGKADVLVGTQMIAKGIDVPNVTLSVVLAADGLLHRPDLSSEEKSLQLFLQLAGRSGRATKKGKVIFQTYKPNHPVIDYLKERNYEGFLVETANLRKETSLFPFCKLCLFKLSGFNYELTQSTAIHLADFLETICSQNNWQLIGPSPSMVSKIGKKFRWQILIHGPEKSNTPVIDIKKLFDLVPKEINLSLDMNPVEM